jgi:hypothetical protein
MKNLFKKQLGTNNVVTEETLEKVKIKTYKNGDEIKVGDTVLYAFLTDISVEQIKTRSNFSDIPMERNEEINEFSLELITLNENQFDSYTYDDALQNKTDKNGIPIIRLK